jgi:N6-L-threonylcarbamoyladenine synthase
MTGSILGIESSCDETAASVICGGREVRSSVVASQFDIHARWGGVVPELASREHLRNIAPVVREAMERAGIGFHELDAIAVTEGPGLAGALLVGVTYAKTLAWALGKPLIAVNHLEGHIHAVLLEHGAQQSAASPALALVVSGGHTHLYLAERGAADQWQYRIVGHTVDDAAGEAFDKVAKLLGLGYPGGPWIDRLAPHGDPKAVPFRFAEVRPREARQRPVATPHGEPLVRFSFSGIKTAVARYVAAHDFGAAVAAREEAVRSSDSPTLETMLSLCDAETLGLIASFQHAVVGNLVTRTLSAAQTLGVRIILVSGGVAANRELRSRFVAECAPRGIPVLFPSVALATDNAAMIAAAAWPKYLRGDHAPAELQAQPRLPLGGC